MEFMRFLVPIGYTVFTFIILLIPASVPKLIGYQLVFLYSLLINNSICTYICLYLSISVSLFSLLSLSLTGMSMFLPSQLVPLNTRPVHHNSSHSLTSHVITSTFLSFLPSFRTSSFSLLSFVPSLFGLLIPQSFPHACLSSYSPHYIHLSSPPPTLIPPPPPSPSYPFVLNSYP